MDVSSFSRLHSKDSTYYRCRVSRRKNALLGRLAFLVTCGLVVLNIAFTSLSTIASIKNYPGGEALFAFHQLYTKPDISRKLSPFFTQTLADRLISWQRLLTYTSQI